MSEIAGKLRVLIVDDEPRIRSVLRRLLQSSCEVVLADGPVQALMMLQRGRAFELILSDYNMPEMSGIEFFSRAAIYSTAMHTLMSGGDDQITAQGLFNMMQGQNRVIDEFLPKPWNPEQLDHILAVARARLTVAPGAP